MTAETGSTEIKPKRRRNRGSPMTDRMCNAVSELRELGLWPDCLTRKEQWALIRDHLAARGYRSFPSMSLLMKYIRG